MTGKSKNNPVMMVVDDGRNSPVWFYHTRAAALRDVRKIMKMANTKERLTGQFSPLSPSDFRISSVKFRSMSGRFAKKVLDGRWGGWSSQKSIAYRQKMGW